MDIDLSLNGHEGDSDFSRSCKKVGQNSIRTAFLASISAHEINSSELWRAAVTETVTTAFLMFTLVVSIISCTESHNPDPQLLIPGVVFLIAFFFLVAILPLSGCHVNPLICFIAALKGVITPVRACVYMLGQCVGSIIGFLLIKSVMSPDAVAKYSLGGCTINANGDGISLGTALMLEFVCTFLFLLLAMTVVFDFKRHKELGMPMTCAVVAASRAIAVYVSFVVTGKPGYAGAGLNPARCLGPALLQHGELWHGHWVFWLGPFFACILYHGFSATLPKLGG